MKKRIVALLLVLTMVVCAFPISAFAAVTENSVGMYGTRDKPTSGNNTSSNWYYSYYTNTAYWVGWHFKTAGKPVYMVQAYLFADGEFNSLLDIDGYFGNNTETQIRAYQYKYTVSKVTTAVCKDKTKNSSSHRSFPLTQEAREIFLKAKADERINRALRR